MSYNLINNTISNQYEFHIDGNVAKIEYTKSFERIFLTHTEVPIKMEGKGIGAQLVKQVLKDIEEKELILVPLCPFVTSYIKRHPEWKRLVMKGIKIA